LAAASPATKSEELFDVVNEHDEVIGQRTRRDVHRLGLNHRAVHLLVFNASGELFLQLRSKTKDCFPGVWDSSASGHVDSGEDYDCCAVRELHEELGLRVEEVPARVFKIDACPQTAREFVWVYRLTTDQPVTANPEEIERGDWFRPDALNEWIARQPEDFAPAFLLVWRRFLDRSETG
jgi:isopentenyldiphosphate isomerase